MEGCRTRLEGLEGYAKETLGSVSFLSGGRRKGGTYIVQPNIPLASIRKIQPRDLIIRTVINPLCRQPLQQLPRRHPLGHHQPLRPQRLERLKRNQHRIKRRQRVPRRNLPAARQHHGKVKPNHKQDNHPKLDVAHLRAVAQHLARVVAPRAPHRPHEPERFVVLPVVHLDEVDGRHGSRGVLRGGRELALLPLDGRVEEAVGGPEDRGRGDGGGEHDERELPRECEGDGQAREEEEELEGEIPQRLRRRELQFADLTGVSSAPHPKLTRGGKTHVCTPTIKLDVPLSRASYQLIVLPRNARNSASRAVLARSSPVAIHSAMSRLATAHMASPSRQR